MKKFIAICLLFTGLAISGQNAETKEKTVNAEETLKEVNDIEGLFVHYSKEFTEGTKELVGSGLELAEKAVDLMVEQSTIIVTQFIVYTSISYAIPIILGLFLVFWLPKKIRKNLSLDAEKAETHNIEVDNDESQYKKDKKRLFLGSYYDSVAALLASNIGTLLSYAFGAYFIVINLKPFIKVTFFSKLYLVDIILKYI